MILLEDWKAINLPGFPTFGMPRRFKWSFKRFRKGMEGKRLKRGEHITHEDRVVMGDMEMMHGGRYWPTTDGGLIALPYDSKKFDFSEWIEMTQEQTEFDLSPEGISKIREHGIFQPDEKKMWSLIDALCRTIQELRQDQQDYFGSLALVKEENKRLKSLTGDFCECCVENDCDCMEGVTWGDGTDDH